MVMIWRDLDALKAFVGDDWREAHVDPSEEELVAHRRLSHFDLAENGF